MSVLIVLWDNSAIEIEELADLLAHAIQLVSMLTKLSSACDLTRIRVPLEGCSPGVSERPVRARVPRLPRTARSQLLPGPSGVAFVRSTRVNREGERRLLPLHRAYREEQKRTVWTSLGRLSHVFYKYNTNRKSLL